MTPTSLETCDAFSAERIQPSTLSNVTNTELTDARSACNAISDEDHGFDVTPMFAGPAPRVAARAKALELENLAAPAAVVLPAVDQMVNVAAIPSVNASSIWKRLSAELSAPLAKA